MYMYVYMCVYESIDKSNYIVSMYDLLLTAAICGLSPGPLSAWNARSRCHAAGSMAGTSLGVPGT